MRNTLSHIFLTVLFVLSLISCDRTPHGVMSVNSMAELIADLQLAEAYIENNIGDFPNDSSKQVIKQSVFKKHGITQQDYDSSLVWYAHNMEDYTKAHDKAMGILKERYDKLEKKSSTSEPGEIVTAEASGPTHGAMPRSSRASHKLILHGNDINSDTADLWQGKRSYMLTQGARRGFITFDLAPDAAKQAGDRYQLAYKLNRGGNEFKVSLNVDYTDGATSQVARGTNSDGWVTIDVQSDTARQVRRIYGYVSYDIKHGHTAYVDSLMLVRTRMSKSNYGFINAQRLMERSK